MSKTLLQKRQERLVILAAVAIIASSVITTLYFTGFIWGGGRSEEVYQNITFTDAVLTCEQQTRSEFRRQLRTLTLDDHSSRFALTTNEYKIFLRAQLLQPTSAEGTGEMFVSCMVSADRGRVTSFEAMEQQSSPTNVIRREPGGIFGWPR